MDTGVLSNGRNYTSIMKKVHYTRQPETLYQARAGIQSSQNVEPLCESVLCRAGVDYNYPAALIPRNAL